MTSFALSATRVRSVHKETGHRQKYTKIEITFNSTSEEPLQRKRSLMSVIYVLLMPVIKAGMNVTKIIAVTNQCVCRQNNDVD